MLDLYLAIYSADREDRPHWALVTRDEDGNEVVYQVLGSVGRHGRWRYDTRTIDMESSRSFYESIRIGRIREADLAEVVALLATVPLRGGSSWSCQSWIMEAIQMLKDENLVTWSDRGVRRVRRLRGKKFGEY